MVEKDAVWARVPQLLNLPVVAVVMGAGGLCSVWVWLATQVRHPLALYKDLFVTVYEESERK